MHPQRLAGNPPSGSAAEAHTPQLITLLMDLGDMHHENLKSAYTAASTFAEKAVAAGDLVAVYWVDSRLHLASPFTREPQQLRDAFEKLSRRTPSGRLTAYDRRSTENEIDDLFTQVYPQTLQGAPPTPLGTGMVTKGSGKQKPSDDEEISPCSPANDASRNECAEELAHHCQFTASARCLCGLARARGQLSQSSRTQDV